MPKEVTAKRGKKVEKRRGKKGKFLYSPCPNISNATDAEP